MTSIRRTQLGPFLWKANSDANFNRRLLAQEGEWLIQETPKPGILCVEQYRKEPFYLQLKQQDGKFYWEEISKRQFQTIGSIDTIPYPKDITEIDDGGEILQVKLNSSKILFNSNNNVPHPVQSTLFLEVAFNLHPEYPTRKPYDARVIEDRTIKPTDTGFMLHIIGQPAIDSLFETLKNKKLAGNPVAPLTVRTQAKGCKSTLTLEKYQTYMLATSEQVLPAQPPTSEQVPVQLSIPKQTPKTRQEIHREAMAEFTKLLEQQAAEEKNSRNAKRFRTWLAYQMTSMQTDYSNFNRFHKIKVLMGSGIMSVVNAFRKISHGHDTEQQKTIKSVQLLVSRVKKFLTAHAEMAGIFKDAEKKLDQGIQPDSITIKDDKHLAARMVIATLQRIKALYTSNDCGLDSTLQQAIKSELSSVLAIDCVEPSLKNTSKLAESLLWDPNNMPQRRLRERQALYLPPTQTENENKESSSKSERSDSPIETPSHRR